MYLTAGVKIEQPDKVRLSREKGLTNPGNGGQARYRAGRDSAARAYRSPPMAVAPSLTMLRYWPHTTDSPISPGFPLGNSST